MHTALPAAALAGSEGACRHVVQFHDQGLFPVAAVADYLWTGIQAGEGALLLTLPGHADTVCASLAERGAAVDDLTCSGRLVERDAPAMTEAILVDGAADPVRFRALIGPLIAAGTAASPRGSVRVYGECVAVLAAEENLAAALATERLWNQLLSASAGTFSLHCGYALQDFAKRSREDVFRQVCDLHDEVVPALTDLDAPDRPGRCIAALQRHARALEVDIEESHRNQARLAAADRRKNEFLAMLGHELRNPLGPITTAVERMNQCDDPRCRCERAVIRRQAAHLKCLVDDLLDIGRITAGNVAIRREPIEIATVVRRAIELLRPAIDHRSHELRVDVASVGLVVDGDPTRLSQIFANLLGNAAAYTDRGGHLEIGARREGDEIVVAFRDDGCGIRPEVQPTLFDLFVRGERALDRSPGGLGLGLALVKIFTELHGGTVTVESDGAGQGSTFTVRLPASAGVHAREVDASAAAPASRTRRGSRVLVVDDNEDATELLAETLGGAGYETMVAYDGPEALQRAASCPPDVVLIDIGLPGMDGYELAERLREARPPGNLRLIALTGYGLDSDRARSRAAGFDVHLVKPVDLDTLVGAIEPAAD